MKSKKGEDEDNVDNETNASIASALVDASRIAMRGDSEKKTRDSIDNTYSTRHFGVLPS